MYLLAISSHSSLLLPWSLRPNLTFSSTVSQGNSAYCWKTMPRSGPGPSTGLPSTVTLPLVGSSSPPMMLSSVDFPQPEGPTTQTNSFS